jgi:peptide chain release factor subunit 1
VSNGLQDVRRLVAYGGKHRVVSLYLDLDPEHFATPPARASQIRSLLDEAARDVDADETLEHDERVALREDVKRVQRYLTSGDAPFKGARALAVFCSSRDDLFETVKLTRPVPARVMIERTPYVEPMIDAVQRRRWLVALVNRRLAILLAGSPDQLTESARREDDVHGQHDQGGWSQARYQRSVEKEVDDHLRETADLVARRWRQERFDRLALGGPGEVVARFQALLPDELRAAEAGDRVEVDLSSATDTEVQAAVDRLAAADEERLERQALDRLLDGIGAGGRAVAGAQETVDALNERRVEVLLLEPTFDGTGAQCPTCGLLLLNGDGACPADGSGLEPVQHLREAVVEAAVSQDASVMAVRQFEDLHRFHGIGALLRF